MPTSEKSAAERERDQAERDAYNARVLNPATYRTLSDRDFALLVKAPDQHQGEMVVVYGEVTQFDAATGETEFRVNTGPNPPGSGASYDTNTYVNAAARPDAVTNVVQGDLVKMYVEVMGSYTYETTMGGSMTVPRFAVNMVENLGPSS